MPSSESDTKPRKLKLRMPIFWLIAQAIHRTNEDLRSLWSSGVVDSIEYFTLAVNQPGVSQALGNIPSMKLRATTRSSNGDCDIARRDGLAMKPGNAGGVKSLPHSALCKGKHCPHSMEESR